MAKFNDPINTVEWVHRDTLVPNEYNPNSVATPELYLLCISIWEDGYTQPIVRRKDQEDNWRIVDGAHRHLTSGPDFKFPYKGDKIRLYDRYEGMVPTVTLVGKDEVALRMSTIRHNRARGEHGVYPMSSIVQFMIEQKIPMEEIMNRLQMEEEEVKRLALRAGIPEREIFKEGDFSSSWTV